MTRWEIIFLVLISFLFGCSLIYLFNRRKERKLKAILRTILNNYDNDEPSVNIESHDLNDLLKELKKSLDASNIKIKELQKLKIKNELKIENQHKQLTSISASYVNKNEDSSLIDSTESDNKREFELDIITTIDINNKPIQYYTIPEEDGSFILNNEASSNESLKYYRIERMDTKQLGKLYLNVGLSDKRAINRIDSYLKPVCEIENISDAKIASRIELLQHGMVILQNDRWFIHDMQKIKIRLI